MLVLDQLVIVNLRGEARAKMPAVLNGLEWQTCLRRILFLNSNENSAIVEGFESGDFALPTVEVFRGHDAYGFLLEVICGLNSPIVGETAVMGQFKDFLLNAKFPNSPWGNFLCHLATNLMIDAKRVRHDHLQGVGSQSYGSLVRHHLRAFETVAVLGTGKLAREIFPWLIGKTKVRVFYRNWQHAKDLAESYPELELIPYSCHTEWEHKQAGLVIAAPLPADEIKRWAASQPATFMKCLDLRGEAATDPIQLPAVIKLNEFFEALRSEREKLQEHVDAARSEIRQSVQRQSQQAQFRPFGWDDLCA
jgi:glutamyl-tRNA reductase